MPKFRQSVKVWYWTNASALVADTFTWISYDDKGILLEKGDRDYFFTWASVHSYSWVNQ